MAFLKFCNIKAFKIKTKISLALVLKMYKFDIYAFQKKRLWADFTESFEIHKR